MTNSPGHQPPFEVRRAVLADVTAHAREDAPRECCGLLLGKGRRVERAVRARNALESRTRYLIHPEDHFAAIRQAREAGEEIVGFYHSHPASPPLPSERDRTEAADPGMLYVIVSGNSGKDEVMGFELSNSGNFIPVTLVLIP